MFPTPAEVLKTREGSLAETPFPVLLQAVLLEEQTCAIELRQRQLEKQVLFEDGAPVGCNTNLLHETLGKYLVERGKLSEQDYQAALNESVQTGLMLGELLVKKQLLSPFDLYKQLQANLAHKILDCFRWADARYRILYDAPPTTSPVRMNAAQLILTGSSNFLPFDVVATHLTFVDEQRFALLPKPAHDVQALKLSPKDVRFLQILRSRPTFAELSTRTATETEPLMRRLFAFTVLGVVAFAEQVPEGTLAPDLTASSPEPAPPPVAAAARPSSAAAAAAVTAPPPPASAPPPSLPFSDEDEALRNELTTAFMENRTKDPFTLLGVPEDVNPVALKKGFLALCDRFSPVRFRTADLREKAEGMLLAAARAYAELANPEQLALWKKRRAAEREKQKGTRPSHTAAEQFRIRTTLLDASSQYAEAQKRFAQKNYRGAVEYFEYACDIDPKPSHRAHLSWAKYHADPKTAAESCAAELLELGTAEPACHEAFYFLGEIRRSAGDFAGAEEAFRKAFKAQPQERRYAELIQQVMKQKR